MENKKPQFLYRGVIVNEKILKESKITGIDLTPPNPPKYDKQGRKTVGDGNEYGLYMSDNKIVTTNAYANVTMRHGTPLNNNIEIGIERLAISIPAVGIVYKISTNGLDVHKPWITEGLTGVYNNGYGGKEWVTSRVPVSNYTIEQVVVGEDILHPKKEIKFNNQEEILSKINLELAERRKRLEKLETFIESLPKDQLKTIGSDELNIYREIYKEDGLMEMNLQTFKISDCSDCIKMIMADYYQSNSRLPMYELKYLTNIQNDKNLSFSDFVKRIMSDIRSLLENKNNLIKKQKSLGNKVDTQSFDRNIVKLSEMYNKYHEIMLKQATMLTGVTFENDFNSIADVRQIEGMYNQKLGEVYDNGELSLQLYQALKKEIREEANNIVSMYKPNMTKNEVNETSYSHNK